MALAPRRDLLGGAVELAHQAIEPGLLLDLKPRQGIEDLGVDGIHGLLDPLAAIAGATVAQLDRLMGAGGGAGGNRGPAEGAVFKGDIHLDGGIAAAVQDFAGGDVDDGGHNGNPQRVAAASF